MSEIQKNRYLLGINKVQDYIEENYFQDISVEKLSEVAGFSKYHFNRIFKSILHESISQYVNRIRIEHAMFLLAHRTDKSLTDIAYELGYTDSAVFSRAFKHACGMSPHAYRKENSTKCKESIYISEYNKAEKTKNWVQKPCSVTGEIRIEQVEEQEAIYVRHVGTYRSLENEFPELLRILFEEAEKQQLLEVGKNTVLAMYHDNPEFSKEEQYRTSLCMTVSQSRTVKETQRLGKMTIEGGLYAIGHFHVEKDQFEDAWDAMYQKWLLTSGYVPRDAGVFEVYLNQPMQEEKPRFEIDIYLPIEPM